MDYSLIDLHTHTIFSREPGCNDKITDVFKDAQKVAERIGKDALVAITDHNTILGVKEARQILSSGEYDKVKLISGAEFTVDMSETNEMFGGNKVFGKMHILGYDFDENNEELIRFSKEFQSGKRNYLKYSELVKLMKNSGGKIVIAHPGLIKVYPKSISNYSGEKYKEELRNIRNNATQNKTILRYVPNGNILLRVLIDKLSNLSGGTLVGIERFHPDNYYKNFDMEIEKICEENNYVQTAGSDFHGYNLHIDFSVGNAFTSNFQEFYKSALQDSTTFRNGLFVSHLPNIEILTGKGEPSKEIKMITANGEEVTYEQYKSVRVAQVNKDSEYPSKKEENDVNKSYKSNSKGYGKSKKGKNKGNQKNNNFDYESQMKA